MSETSNDGGPATPERSGDREVRYPTDHLLAVIDTPEQAAVVVDALTSGGFLESEVHVSCGSDSADALRDSTGRRGLAGLAIRIAERLGIEDPEMEMKSFYEESLREGGFVLRVLAPTPERKARAIDILREQDAHAISFLGRYTVETIEPPRR